MPKIIDITGKVFGELTVLGAGESRPRVNHVGTMKMWRCRCICGNEIQVETQNLKRRSPSCGCMRGQKISAFLLRRSESGLESFPRHPKPERVRRPESYERLAWRRMHRRCRNPTGKDRLYYKGVTVCERWTGPGGFRNFLSDMGRCPSPTHSIDRIEGAKVYGPETCRWATKKQQSENRRTTHWIEFDGRRQCAADWARELGICAKVIYGRIKAGLAVEKVLSRLPIAYKDRRWNPPHKKQTPA